METIQSCNTFSISAGNTGHLGAQTASRIETLKSIKIEVTRIKVDFNNFSKTSEGMLNKRL